MTRAEQPAHGQRPAVAREDALAPETLPRHLWLVTLLVGGLLWRPSRSRSR